MMGQQGRCRDRLFYSFNLEQHVPSDHLLRGIDRYFDPADLRLHLAPFNRHTGRPSINPELVIRMLRGQGVACSVRATRSLNFVLRGRKSVAD
jgi:hypothetical protein